MTFLYIAASLAILAAIGHSTISEMKFLRPLRAETHENTVFSGLAAKRLASGMFHMASISWGTMGIAMLLLEPGHDGYRPTLHLFAAVFAMSGLGNFWIVGKLHPGGVLLLGAGILVLASLYF